jgi:hypothetical protein
MLALCQLTYHVLFKIETRHEFTSQESGKCTFTQPDRQALPVLW